LLVEPLKVLLVMAQPEAAVAQVRLVKPHCLMVTAERAVTE
jgi:hypothetical protein